MSGKPAARIGDAVAKGKIISGSATVLIGDKGDGEADQPSSCEPQSGNPVNPVLGVKLLPGETDFALSAPAPFAFTRSYLSSNSRIGALGQGWSILGEGVALEVSDEATTVIDAQGRRITFGPLAPGEARFSPSERLWIRRGGPIIPQLDALTPWTGRWASVPHEVRHDPGLIFIATGAQFLQFRCVEGLGRLTAHFDRNGYRTAFHWARLPGIALLANEDTRPPQPDQDADWLVRYDYSGAGDLVAVIDRAGHTVRTFQWQQHLMIGHAVPGGLEVRYEWDRLTPDGKVVRQIETDGLTRDYAYGPDYTTVTDSLGRVDTYHFTGEGPDTRWSAHTRADGSRLAFRYDGFGRKVADVDPLERTTHSQLDGEGRLIGRTLPDRSRWHLDPDSGEAIEINAPGNLTWRIERDARANPIAVTAPDGAITRYAYADPNLPDRPTAITDPKGGVRRLEWNHFGALTAHTDCSGHATRYTYDDEGRLVAETNALCETTVYRNDRLGRVVELERPDGAIRHYQYDPHSGVSSPAPAPTASARRSPGTASVDCSRSPTPVG